MQSPAVPAKTPDLRCGKGSAPSFTRSQTSIPGLTFLMLCGLITLGATRPVDWWGQSLLVPVSAPLLDLTGFLLTLLGEAQITGTIAVVLTIRGWQHYGEHGLGPLLLFVGVGLEVLLKYLLPHPGPPAEFTRHLNVPDFLRLSSCLLRVSTPPVLLRVTPPYSFPSGHMLRATFLVMLASERKPQWRMLGWVVVVAMAVTRVYCNEHWMSDVVGGALLGWTLAGVATALEDGQKRGSPWSREGIR